LADEIDNGPFLFFGYVRESYTQSVINIFRSTVKRHYPDNRTLDMDFFCGIAEAEENFQWFADADSCTGVTVDQAATLTQVCHIAFSLPVFKPAAGTYL
jgi:hypothetical protein